MTENQTRLQTIPALNHDDLRDCQITAVENLEVSFKDDRPRPDSDGDGCRQNIYRDHVHLPPTQTP